MREYIHFELYHYLLCCSNPHKKLFPFSNIFTPIFGINSIGNDGAVAAMANELRALTETDTENNVGVMCVAQDVTKAIKLWQQW